MTANLISSTRALVVKEAGFTKVTPTGPYVDSLDPYLDLAEVAVPAPSAGQVLVENILGNINPSDVHFIKGEYGLPRTQGMAAGFEGVGRVIAAGEGAEGLVGKRVAYIGPTGGTGAWAQHAVIAPGSYAPVPDQLSDEDAAALFVNPLTAVGMVELAIANSIENTREKENGAVILTAANSQLGKLAVGYAKSRGFKTITVCRRQEAADDLAARGADVSLCSADPDFAKQMGAAIAEHKPRMMLDAVADNLAAEIFWHMPRGSRWVIYGLLDTTPTSMTQMGQFVFMKKKVEGFWLTDWFLKLPQGEQARLVMECAKRFISGEWKTDMDEIISLDEAHAKLPAALARPNSGKVMIRP